MIVLREMRRRAKALVGPVLGMALTGYFAYHLVEGDRGLRAWVRLTQQLHAATDDLAAVSAERAELEHRVSQMRPDHVDPDLLDTQVRRTLDVAAPDEIVIMTPSSPSPSPPPDKH
jgi:cell division protein FtsB